MARTFDISPDTKQGHARWRRIIAAENKKSHLLSYGDRMHGGRSMKELIYETQKQQSKWDSAIQQIKRRLISIL